VNEIIIIYTDIILDEGAKPPIPGLGLAIRQHAGIGLVSSTVSLFYRHLSPKNQKSPKGGLA
jgi:hypothetical protein